MIGTIIESLYDGFPHDTVGEDYALRYSEGEAQRNAEKAALWGEINEARKALGVLAYDGILLEATLRAMVESDPDLLTDRLLEVAANALAYAASVQRQAAEFNSEEE